MRITPVQQKLILIAIEFYIKAQGHHFTNILSPNPLNIDEFKQLREILKLDLIPASFTGNPSKEEFCEFYFKNGQSRERAENDFFILERKNWQDVQGNSITHNWKDLMKKIRFK
jgi:hypothetical protein